MNASALVEEQTREQWLHVGPDIILGEFHLSPGTPGWDEDRPAPQGHLITFPTSSCWIRQDGHEPVVADRGTSTIYNPETIYRRSLLDPRGDHCLYLVAHPELTRECAAEWDHTAAHGEAFRFPLPTAPINSRARALIELAAGAAGRPSVQDPLELEEALYAALRLAVMAALVPMEPRAREASTQRAHHVIVQEVKASLALRFADRLSLADLATEVHVSPYHLTRLFRAATGFTIRGYRTRLRLHASLEEVAHTATDLATVAIRLGFADPSHFANVFRRVFGLSPRSFRRRARAGLVAETRTILQV